MYFYDLILYVQINSFSVMSGRNFLGLTSTKQRIKCLAQEHNPVALVRLEPATPRFRVNHSIAEPMHSSKTISLSH